MVTKIPSKNDISGQQVVNTTLLKRDRQMRVAKREILEEVVN